MSRPQRIIYSNAFYHVMNRGAGRQKIFNDRLPTTLELNKTELNTLFQNRLHLTRKFLIHNGSVDVIQEIISGFSYDQNARTLLQRGQLYCL